MWKTQNHTAHATGVVFVETSICVNGQGSLTNRFTKAHMASVTVFVGAPNHIHTS